MTSTLENRRKKVKASLMLLFSYKNAHVGTNILASTVQLSTPYSSQIKKGQKMN